MSTQKIYVGSDPNSISLVDNSVTKILLCFFFLIFLIYCFLNITGEFMDEIGNEFGMIWNLVGVISMKRACNLYVGLTNF